MSCTAYWNKFKFFDFRLIYNELNLKKMNFPKWPIFWLPGVNYKDKNWTKVPQKMV